MTTSNKFSEALALALSGHIDAYMDGLITREEMRQKMIIEAHDFLMALLKEPS